jgi:hypothetical protein
MSAGQPDSVSTLIDDCGSIGKKFLGSISPKIFILPLNHAMLFTNQHAV